MRKLNSQTKTLLRDPRKRRSWIIYQLKLEDKSVASVADTISVRRQTLYKAFDRPYPRMEKVLADALNIPPQQLFPERYDKDGLPNRKRKGAAPVMSANNTIITTGC